MSTHILKVFISGEGGVGKTTLVDRLIHGRFNANTMMTIGVQHSLYDIKVPGDENRQITLQLWDLGGEERFKTILPIYVQGSQGGIVVFDESRFPTWRNLPEWINIVKRDLDPEIPIILISTKSDLVENQLISEEEMDEFMKEHGIKAYFRTSSKSGENVKNVFEKLVEFFKEKDII